MAQARRRPFHWSLKASGKVESVVSPLTILRFSDSLVRSPDGNPTNSVAAKALLAAQAAEAPGSPAAAARTADSLATLKRLNAVPEAERTFDNPEWVKFLLYNNEGKVRKALTSVFLNDHTAQIVTRLPGNTVPAIGGSPGSGAAATQYPPSGHNRRFDRRFACLGRRRPAFRQHRPFGAAQTHHPPAGHNRPCDRSPGKVAAPAKQCRR